MTPIGERTKAKIDPYRPVAAFAERELGPNGAMLNTATILIANRECPFRCVYCDLWQHTLDEPTPIGAVPEQIDAAFATLGSDRFDQVKLYNAGNWFDGKAIPERDHQAIATKLDGIGRVVIENHPKLCDDRVLAFRDQIRGELEIAIGVETIDPEIMSRLDKSMTVDDTERAIAFLRDNGVDVRAFVLFPPPFQVGDIVTPAADTFNWCAQRGVASVVLIPLRTQTGMMSSLVESGEARDPRLDELERSISRCVQSNLLGAAVAERPRLFVDLWDAESHFAGESDAEDRIARLRRFNDEQVWR